MYSVFEDGIALKLSDPVAVWMLLPEQTAACAGFSGRFAGGGKTCAGSCRLACGARLGFEVLLVPITRFPSSQKMALRREIVHTDKHLTFRR